MTALKECTRRTVGDCNPRLLRCSEVYLDRVQSQEELVNLTALCMKDKERITYDEFLHIVNNISCEMFLCVPPPTIQRS
jgi:hypothetical protein